MGMLAQMLDEPQRHHIIPEQGKGAQALEDMDKQVLPQSLVSACLVLLHQRRQLRHQRLPAREGRRAPLGHISVWTQLPA
mmetsp:Transcript_432/g.788  ORF Transcript_432/g.788 Transcript_432/m.788 type:complete len:80 (+) Transcript_432:592-831(+)